MLISTFQTVLASFLVRYLREQKHRCVLYFFCKAHDVEKREAIHVHRTLLAQLLHHDESLYDCIEPFYTCSGRATADSGVDVGSALSTAFSKTLESRINIILDALDKCQDYENLVRSLSDLRNHTSSPINLVVTSRKMPLSVTFDEEMIFEVQSSDQPIYEYISHRVHYMKALSDGALARRVVREVSQAADGLWLYARLILDEIERLPSAVFIQRHLRNVPRGLTQLYTQILQAKESRFTDVELMFAQQIYLWFDESDYMPSFLFVDCLSYDTLSLILQKVNFGQAVFDPIDLVSRLCSPLIKATDFSDENEKLTSCSHDYEITAIHHTVDQYIQESQHLPAIKLPLVLKPRRLRQLHRGATAAWFYTACEVSAKDLAGYRDNPYGDAYGSYFEMAYGLWGALQFTDLPTDLDTDEMTEAIALMGEMTDFVDSKTGTCLRWIESAIIINYAGKWSQLLENAERGLALMQRHHTMSRHPCLENYRLVREVFFIDYVYVLRVTGPGPYVGISNIPKAENFDKRPLAVKMLEIGRKWQYLYRRV